MKNSAKKNIRLTPNEVESILTVVNFLAKNSEVYLFGSRVFEDKKGGDIDLLIFSEQELDKIDLIVKLKHLLGERKIDIIISNRNEMKNDAFVQKAFSESVDLKKYFKSLF